MWHAWPAICLVLSLLVLAVSRGWWCLRRKGHAELASGVRLTAYLAGLGVLGMALLSDLDHLQQVLFAAHMVQHELIMMVAAPLMVWADPFPLLLWALPRGVRRAIGGAFKPRARTRRVLVALAAPRTAWLAYVGSLWLWHSPTLYQAALRHESLHALEHVTFLLTSLLFWWHVIQAAPRLRVTLSHWARVGFVLGALAQNEILGVAIAFAGGSLYPYYAAASQPWGLSVIEDQMLAGAIMWIPGGMMYAVAAVLLVTQLLDVEAPVPVAARRTDVSPTAASG
jgi:putative membrane protein